MFNRRDFLKLQASALASISILGWTSVRQIALAADSQQTKPDLAVVSGSPGAATREAVKLLGGMESFVKPGQKVVIKPNMSFASGVETATNTHPEVVRELAAMCKEAGAASVMVLDHAFYEGKRSLEASGILAACDGIQPGICRNATQSRLYRDTGLENAKEMRGNAIMTDALDADVIISAPVAKSHSSTGVSLSIKGQMGLVLDRDSMHSRYDLDTAIVDLCQKLMPNLVVIDASRVLSTNGPEGPGQVLKPGEIIASRDPVAADAMTVASYEWYGKKIQPRQVGHLVKAQRRGLGRMDLENLLIARSTI